MTRTLLLTLNEKRKRRPDGNTIYDLPNYFPNGIDSLTNLFKNPSEEEDPITGSALLLVCDLQNNLGPYTFGSHASKLETPVRNLVTQESTSSLALQVAAIEAAGRLKLQTSLPQIQKNSRNQDADLSIRLNSLVVLSYYDEPQDIDYLKSLSEGDSG